MATALFLVHGLGPAALTGMSLLPLRYYLQWQGHENVHIVHYEPDACADADEALDQVDAEMRKHWKPEDGPIRVVGQSMGGVLAHRLHQRGWDVQKSLSIGSPLHGARLLDQLEARLPEKVVGALRKPMYSFLQSKDTEPAPPHAFHTISLGWAWSDFDGCVYRDEATLDTDNHTHLSWADHRAVFFNPRLWTLVNESLAL